MFRRLGSVRAKRVGIRVGAAACAALSVWGVATLPSTAADTPSAAGEDGPAQAATNLVEVQEKRTRTTRTFRDGHGRFVSRLYTEPVNFRDSDGTWRVIDNRLEASASDPGVVSNRANRYEVRLPRRLGAPVRVEHAGRWIQFSLAGAPNVEGIFENNSARYSDVADGVDLGYVAESDAVKETLTLAHRDTPSTYRFDFEASAGLRARNTREGTVEVVDSDDRVRFSFARPVMYDAAGTASEDVSLAATGEGTELVLRASDEWIDSPKRKFPIVVDPMVTLGTQAECMIAGAAKSDDYMCWGWDYFSAGDGGASTPRRTLMRFDMASAAIPQDAQVTKARLSMRPRNTNFPAGSIERADVHRVTESWDAADVTWNHRNATQSWTTPGGAYKQDPEWSQAIGSPGDWHEWYITDAAQGWVTGAYDNHGVIVKHPTDGANGEYVGFESSASTGNEPSLEVWWEPRTGRKSTWGFSEHHLEGIDLGVNVGNGNLVLNQTDAVVPDAGTLDYVLSRTYNGRAYLSSTMGYDWSLDAGDDVRLVFIEDGQTIFLTEPGLAQHRIRRRADGTWETPAELEASFRLDNGQYVLDYAADGRELVFDLEGRLVEERDSDGDSTFFHHNGPSDRLSTVTDEHGGTTQINYNANGWIDSVVLPSGQGTHQYEYGGPSNGHYLTKHTAPNGKVTHYEYSYGSLVKIITSDGNETSLTFDADQRVTRIVRGVDETTFSYFGRASLGSCPAESAGRTVETRPDGTAMTYCYDSTLSVRQTMHGSTPPTLTLSGTLYDSRDSALQPGTYQLDFQANDAAGIAKIEVSLDGEVVTESGAQGSWQLDTFQHLPGLRTVTVRATDNDGHVSTHAFYVTIPEPPAPADWQEDEPTAANQQPITGAACEAHYGAGSRYCAEPASSIITPRSVFTTELIYGLSHDDHVDSPATFLDREEFDPANGAHLPIKRFRRVIPYNVMDFPRRVAEFRRFYEAAIAYEDRLRANAATNDVRVDFFVSFWFRCDSDQGSCFKQSNFDHRPTVNEYLEDVRAFKNAFPRVRWISAFNEPNGRESPFRTELFGPRAAVVLPYYLERDVCARVQTPATPCNVVAADLAQDVQVGGWLSYLREYVDAFQDRRNRPDAGRFPAHWGFHPYVDVKQQRDPDPAQDVEAARRRIGTFRFIDDAPDGSRIWFSEAGSRVDTGRNNDIRRNTLQSQAEEIDYLVDDLATSNGDASDPRAAIDRVYYYSYCAPDSPDEQADVVAARTFDSALLGQDVPNRAECSSQPRRPAFSVFRDRATRNPYG